MRADEGHGDEGRAGREREPRRAALVAALLVRQRRPLREEPDDGALLEQLHTCRDGPARVRAPLDGECACGKEDLLDAGHPVQLRLRHEPDLPRDGDAEEEAVHHRHVVGGQHTRAGLRHVLATRDPHAVDEHEDWPEGLLDDRVHGAIAVHYGAPSSKRASSARTASSHARARGRPTVRPQGERTAAPWSPPRTSVYDASIPCATARSYA